MTGGRDQAEILKDRLDTVLALTEANAEEARARAGLGGAEIGRLSAQDASPREIDRAEGRESVAEERLATARSRVAELEAALDALDSELAAAYS